MDPGSGKEDPQYQVEDSKQLAEGARSLGHPRRRATIIPSRRMPSEGERRTPAHVRRKAKDKDVP
jgi:hypothetical protein